MTREYMADTILKCVKYLLIVLNCTELDNYSIYVYDYAHEK